MWEVGDVMIRKLLLLWKYRNEARMALSNLLRILEKDTNAEVVGGLTDDETAGLISWLPDEGVFVEFGTLFGLTAKAVAAAKPRLRVVAVDNFSWNPFGLPPDMHEAFTRRILTREISEGRVDVIRSTSEGYRERSKIAPTAVFFDALHQYEPVKAEIEWAKRIGVQCICGHDYHNPSPVFGVTRAVDESFPCGVDVCGMCWRGRDVIEG